MMRVLERRTYGEGRWKRAMRLWDGTICLYGGARSADGGRAFSAHGMEWMDDVLDKPERCILSRPGLFLALGGRARAVSRDTYRLRAWRSTDELGSVQEEEVALHVPDGPDELLPGERESSWHGLYAYRVIIESNGALLATMEGNLRGDNIPPFDSQSKLETRFKQRSFLIRSEDDGRSWDYVSTIAVPSPEDPVGEGFTEPALARLADGRLLCVMRTGHHFPLYASWSEDEGKTWSAPLYTGLDRGCDPCLVPLRDGRLALTYGKRFPEGWSRIVPGGDKSRWVYPGEGLLKLAISDDGTGEAWRECVVDRRCGSCYSTTFEVEPGVLFSQVDGWTFRIELDRP